jgi:hypothetical protein
MNKKLRSFRKRNQAKERKKDKRRLHEEKGEKSHKDLYVSYHAIDEPSLAANVFRPPKFSSQYLLDHGKFYFSTLQQLS